MRDFRKLLAWQRADDLTVLVYRATEDFPSEEKFGLTSQLRRAAVSVAANIAEGSGRHSLKDFRRFLYQARGSLSEVQYYLHLSKRLD
jgi:four helix bundle protein